MTALLALVISIRPAKAITIPASMERAVYAQFLNWVDAQDSALAAQLHDAEGVKPFTCSKLVGGKYGEQKTRSLQTDTLCWFRITALDDHVANVLRRIIETPPAALELDGHRFWIDRLTTDSQTHQWAGETTYEDLSAPYLLARETPPRRLHLRFSTPTFFRQNQMNTPIPLPELVFGSLCDRWNRFSPVAVSDGMRQYAAQCMAISQYTLRSSVLIGKDTIPQIGGIGSVRYSSVQYDKYWMSVAALLSDYAFYAGVGRRTTFGAGQTRRLS